MVTVRLLKAVELENEETLYFEKKFKVEKECLDMPIIDEDGKYEPEEKFYDAPANEIIGAMDKESFDDDEKDEFDEVMADLKTSGWRQIEGLPARLESIF